MLQCVRTKRIEKLDQQLWKKLWKPTFFFCTLELKMTEKKQITKQIQPSFHGEISDVPAGDE